jgi:hypothetical protein
MHFTIVGTIVLCLMATVSGCISSECEETSQERIVWLDSNP